MKKGLLLMSNPFYYWVLSYNDSLFETRLAIFSLVHFL